MVTINDFDHVLVEYKRKNDGTPKGVVVSIGPNIVGWSLCKSPDVFHKNKGLGIALERALKASQMSLFDRIAYYEKCPFTLEELLTKMADRSLLYYKIPSDEYIHDVI